MCVVSMVMDHYYDEWNKKRWPQPEPPSAPNAPTPPPGPFPPYIPMPPAITPEEVAEFRRLLERAREYDKKNNEPDCELEEKKQKLLDLAKELGVEINFL